MTIETAEIDETETENLSDEMSEEEIPEETETEESAETSEEAPEGEEELVVTFGDSPAPEEDTKGAPEWVKELRKSHKELQRENRELKERFKTTEAATQVPTVGKKPSLQDDDIAYDTEKFETALANWYESKRQADEYQKQLEQAQRAEQEEWQNRLNSYSQAKTNLKVKDFDEAEENVKDVLSVTQQGILLKGAKDPALLVYSLGKNPKKAREIAAIKDPIKFAFELAALEKDMKTSSRKPSPPQPEKTVNGTGRISGGSSNATLAKLRDEAARTGDFTKLHAYKRQIRDK
ncbi:scaffolding protein [Caudoviricetes sp.]|nr:scaffolding protein [Caudoviricetes sp.]